MQFQSMVVKVPCVLSVLLSLAILVCPAAGALINIDADGYADDTDISTAFAGVTLSSAGGYAGLDGAVYAHGDGLATTGSNVFANNTSFERQWHISETDGFALRADFDWPANYVAIDIIGDDAVDFGVLEAYNSDDTLLQSAASGQLDYGDVFTAVISRGSFDISYIIAGGTESPATTVHLDNLQANVIPEPTTILLLGVGALMLRRKKISHESRRGGVEM